MTASDELGRLRDLFAQEFDERLSAFEQALVVLEQRPDDPEPLHELFRVAHTIKGSAAMVGLDRVADYAHSLEDALDMMRDGVLPVTALRVTLLLQIGDALRELLAAESSGRATQIRSHDRALITRLIRGTADAVTGGHDEHAAPRATGELPALLTSTRGRGLRVEMEKLDAMLDLTGEIIVAKGQLEETLSDPASTPAQARTALEGLDRVLSALQERVMQLRLVPVGPLFRQHVRTVRDVAVAQGKLIRLDVEGEDVEMDAAIVERLRDPLTHLVRNALDHGVEYPAARHGAGKDPCATITLRARHEGGAVVVEVSDDGAGIQRDRVLATARARGLTGADGPLDDAEVLRLITTPGFSTAEQVTDLSGRGVGMDVVRRELTAVRGTLELSSAEGVGTTMRARLPLTVAIIDGFVVGVGDERYVIPIDAVSECVALGSQENDRAATGLVRVRDEAVPYVRLRDAFGITAAPPARESVVVVHDRGRRAALVVDRLLGEAQAVVKPLDALLAGAPGVSATTVTRDGRVSLVVDVPALLARVTGTGSR